MDAGSLGGILLALAGILVGLLLEGGHLRQVLQPTAALIVFGGTLGAVMLQFPFRTVLTAALRLVRVFLHRDGGAEAMLRDIVHYANKARRKGIVSLDQDLPHVANPFLRQALMLAVDGTEPSALRHIMDVQIDNAGELEARIPAVFESAGGFSPTIGIIGAVIGLIQVMQHLDHMDQVGRGIAVAFVATIYGVGAANLFFLPAAGKLRQRAREEQRLKEMALEGVISILEGMNPRMIEIKLAGFLGTSAAPQPALGSKGEIRA
ncbi:MAG TPA: flagellar motor protein [Acidobacteriaceae bacterium]|nr:flagellar motor protein [Acidobacteriaceae bacterium]